MYDKVVEIIARQLQIDTDIIDEHTKIMEDLGADSLDVVEMLMAMEETFGFSIPDEDIEELVTVSDIVEYVESNMENCSTPPSHREGIFSLLKTAGRHKGLCPLTPRRGDF